MEGSIYHFSVYQITPKHCECLSNNFIILSLVFKGLAWGLPVIFFQRVVGLDLFRRLSHSYVRCLRGENSNGWGHSALCLLPPHFHSCFLWPLQSSGSGLGSQCPERLVGVTGPIQASLGRSVPSCGPILFLEVVTGALLVQGEK